MNAMLDDPTSQGVTCSILRSHGLLTWRTHFDLIEDSKSSGR
jgi:hypothetical protein